MIFRYVQATGKFYGDGALWGIGYSGNGLGRNEPTMQAVRDVGPLPAGWYTIGEFSNEKGPRTIRLEPDPGNEMHGRGGFLIHGDNSQHNQSASHGCIILGVVIRQRIMEYPGARLQVVPVEQQAVQST